MSIWLLKLKNEYVDDTEITLSKYAKIPNKKFINNNLYGSLSKTSINLTTNIIKKELKADIKGIKKGISFINR